MLRWALQRGMIGIVRGIALFRGLCSGFYSNGFSAVHALAHAGFRGVCWVRRVAFSRAQAVRRCFAIDPRTRRLPRAPWVPTILPKRLPFRPNSRSSRAGSSPPRAMPWIAAIGGRPTAMRNSISCCGRSRFPTRRSRPRPRLTSRRAPLIREAQAALFPTLTGELQLYPHADRAKRRRRRIRVQRRFRRRD